VDETTARRRVTALAAVAGAGVVGAALVLAPRGPWDVQEAWLAEAVVDFDLRRSGVEPPGAPGLILLAKATYLVAPEALRALRLWSCLAAAVVVWGLTTSLADRIGPARALAVAVLVPWLPGPWAHAAVAGPGLPAVGAAVAALGCWRGPPTKGRALTGWVFLGLAFSIRPQLAVPLALVAAAGVWHQRARLGIAVHGVLVAIAVVLAILARTAIDTGGPIELFEVLAERTQRQLTVLADRGALPWTQQGLVVALGGPATAVTWLAVAAVGAGVAWVRHGWPGRWLVLLALAAVTSGQRLQDPASVLGALPAVVASAPLIGLASGLVPARIAVAVASVAAVLAAIASFPAIAARHREPLPVWSVLAGVSRDEVVVTEAAVPWVRLARATGHLRAGPGRSCRIFAGRPPVLPGRTVEIVDAAPLPPEVVALAPHGSTAARRVCGAPVAGDGVYAVEVGRRGEVFAWLGSHASFELPPGAAAFVAHVEVDAARAPQVVRARGPGATLAELVLDAPGPGRLEVPLDRCADGCRVDLELPQARVTGDDPRALSVRLRAAWAEGPGLDVGAVRFSPGRPGSVAAADAQLEGFFAPESFRDGRAAGAWTGARARIALRMPRGRLRVQLTRPGHVEGAVVLRTSGHLVEVEPGPEPKDHWIDVDAPDGRDELVIEAPTFVPSHRDPSRTDDRALGVVVLEVELVPTS
jgi:hypothetical protein